MKLLLDECVVHDLRHELRGHEVFTVAFMGWSGVKNGRLLEMARSSGFDAMVSTDGEIEFQQNLDRLPLAIYALEAASNDLDDLLPLVPNLLAANASYDGRPRIIHVRL